MKTKEDYESEIAELQLQIEDMEYTNSLVFGVLFSWLTFSLWHNWWFTAIIGVSAACLYWKLWAKRPFSSEIDSA